MKERIAYLVKLSDYRTEYKVYKTYEGACKGALEAFKSIAPNEWKEFLDCTELTEEAIYKELVDLGFVNHMIFIEKIYYVNE